MLIVKGLRAAPTGLASLAKSRAVVLTWTAYSDPDHAEMLIYRYPTSTDADDDTNSVLLGRSLTEKFRDDDDLTIDDDYWYRISSIDIYGNESTKSAVVMETYTGVNEIDVNPNVVAPPASATLTDLINKDIDDDGKIDIALRLTWPNQTGAKTYQVEIDDGTGNTSLHMVAAHSSGTSFFRFKASTSRTYTCYVWSISFSGVIGTSFVTSNSVTPTGKSAAPTTPGAGLVVGGLGLNVVSWPESSDADYAFSELYYHTGTLSLANVETMGTKLSRISGNIYLDTKAWTTYGGGANGYYWVRNYDTSGNVSPFIFIGSGNAGLAAQNDISPLAIATGKLQDQCVTAAKIENFTITSTQLSSDCISTGKIQDNAVTAAKIANGLVIRASSNTNGSQSVGTSNTTVQSVSVPHTTDNNGALIICTYTVTTGGVTLQSDLKIGSTIVHSPGNISACPTGGYTIVHEVNSGDFSGSSSTVSLILKTSSGSITVINCKIVVAVFKR